MKAVILAAGLGTRLANARPKPLTPLHGDTTILDHQVAALSALVGPENIVIVVGYKKELLMERFPHALYVYNPLYAGTNTAKSLLAALRKLDDDVLWMNGDVFFEPPVLQRLADAPGSGCLVNTARCAEEEVKYTLNARGTIAALSKSVEAAAGEAVGINLIRRAGLADFVGALDAVAPGDYFEKALEDLLRADKLTLHPVSLDGYYCREVDFAEDMEDVRQFIRKHPEYAS
jgi:choline kinase